MPGFDQTGPVGKGPQTGGRRGPCATENDTQSRQRGFGRRIRRNNINQEGTSRGWRLTRRGGGDGSGPGFGGGLRRRFRRGQD